MYLREQKTYGKTTTTTPSYTRSKDTPLKSRKKPNVQQLINEIQHINPNRVLFSHRQKWSSYTLYNTVNLKSKAKKPDTKGHTLYDSTSIKCPEWPILSYRQWVHMVVRDLGGGGRGNGEWLLRGSGVSLQGDENVLKWHNGDVFTTFWIY